jgi:hypothetical protein
MVLFWFWFLSEWKAFSLREAVFRGYTKEAGIRKWKFGLTAKTKNAFGVGEHGSSTVIATKWGGVGV